MSEAVWGQIQNKSRPLNPYSLAVLIEDSMKDFRREVSATIEDRGEELSSRPNMDRFVADWPFHIESRVTNEGFLSLVMLEKEEKYWRSEEGIESSEVEEFTAAKAHIR